MLKIIFYMENKDILWYNAIWIVSYFGTERKSWLYENTVCSIARI